ncbi:MAG TPA: hypothetical protein VEF06_00005, partial [Bryobacteraceae bacterium]|nr:hypothetical protein [Bryobacteraceae bacterium]
MTATLPSGEVLTLLSIKDWDFAWQDRYFFDHFITLPKGTRIDSEVHWDNTSDNPRNPSNPPIQVRWGEQSKDEMGAIGLQGVPHDEADLKALQLAVRQHTMGMAQRAVMMDPTFLPRMREMFGGELPTSPFAQ